MKPKYALISAILLIASAGVLLFAGAPPPAPAKVGPRWKQLIGEWRADNAAGGGSGVCGFHFDLSECVIVRTNHAQLSQSAAVHDDLMVISPDRAPEKGKAIYFDNEGHVIDYTAEWTADGNTLTFVSKPGAGPRFRLIYKRESPETMNVSFEMAMPGQGDAFKPYTSGKIRRTGG